MSSSETFYWHDYETFGADPARDRPAQFAGLRTDAELNVIGEPLVIFARPANDYLPHPDACLITGITPQQALREGVAECEFIARIHEQLAAPGTCGVGYNSLRFDDEVTRHTLYRNFFDPYAREWRSGNSRWDIIDMLRAACALRPEGIEWPLREDGLPSFRLQDLSAANGLEHAAAHDALSDVRATLAVAKLVRERQPRLYDYLLGIRSKAAVAAMLDTATMTPLLHVSGMFGAARHNTGMIVPLVTHPDNRNEIICFDLAVDPAALIDGDPDALRQVLYTRAEDLPAGTQRPGLKSVHLNRCPVLVSVGLKVTPTTQRLAIDIGQCERYLAQLRAWRDGDEEAFRRKLAAIYGARDLPPVSDPDLMLYSGGFFSDQDRRTMDRLRQLSPDQLANNSFVFADTRLPEMLFRYRARNYPQTLSPAEQERWEAFRYARLAGEEPGGNLTLETYNALLEQRLAEPAASEAALAILRQLEDWGDAIAA